MVDLTIPFSNEFLDSEVRCRHLVDICPDAIMIHHNNRVVIVNDECLRLLGASQHEQVLGLSPFDLVPADGHAFLAEQNGRVVAQQEPAPLAEMAVRQVDGGLVTLESLAVPLPLPDGSTAVLVVLRNSLGRKRTVEDRERSDVQVRNIIDTAMDGIISMNDDQNIVLFNAAAESIFGWRAEQVIGQSIELLIPGHFRPQHRRDVQQFGQGLVQHRRMGTQRTVMALRASGEEFPIEASISHSTINDKKIYTAIVRDVTEAVRHRQEIERQAQILDQISDAVSVVDLQGRITYWNQAACRLYGWAADEVLEQKAHEVLYRGDPEVLHEMLREVNARRSWAGELTKVSRSGKTIIVEHRRTVLQDANGLVTGYLCIDIDITDRKKYERASRRSQRLESIGTLAGGIAHDLNNVLTPILMGAKLLSSGRSPTNSQGLLNTMVASAERGAGLIKQLLAFAGGIRGEQSRVDMKQLLAETRGLLEHTLPKSIQIEIRGEEVCPPVLGDATELSQVLTNLCINARDAMPDGGTLTVEAASIQVNGNASQLHPDARPGPYALLKVSDTGCGMGPEVLDRIFDPFYTTKDVGKGTGLGLATVQGIVKSHGGFIVVYSEPGNGSKFSVYLPTIATDESTANVFLGEAIAESGNGRTILLVDDEAFILQMTAAALEADGYRVLTARDGSAAMVMFSQHCNEISAVILDLMMPGLDGLQTLDQLRRIDPGVAVIASSGLRTSQREAEVLERGAKAFLPKPYSETELLQTLSRVLKSPS